jgi:hypothetical protein
MGIRHGGGGVESSNREVVKSEVPSPKTALERRVDFTRQRKGGICAVEGEGQRFVKLFAGGGEEGDHDGAPEKGIKEKSLGPGDGSRLLFVAVVAFTWLAGPSFTQRW